MADGYARASGRVGVALATSGPGATNLVTGIATAMLDSSPVVFITGQVASSALGTDAFQETDITGVTLPITKHNFLVTRTEQIAPALADAFRIAAEGRPGPVLVDVTKDAQQGDVRLRRTGTGAARPRAVPASGAARRPEDLERACELIAGAERPLLLLGPWRAARRRDGARAGLGRGDAHAGGDDAPRHRRLSPRPTSSTSA